MVIGLGGGAKQEVEVEVRSSGISGFTNSMDQAIAGMISFRGAAFALGSAVAGLSAALITVSVGAAREYNGAIRELTKVTDEVTADELGRDMQNLAQEIPLATTELVDIATAAARFGVASENVEMFTETVAKMAFATDLSVGEAGQAFARLSKLTETPIEDIERLGSTINMLGQTSATSSREIVDNMLRSSAALNALGLSAPEIASLAAALNEVSESSERAGTRLRRLAETLQTPQEVEEIALAYYETERAIGVSTAALEAADAQLAAAANTYESQFKPAVDAATQVLTVETSELRDLESQLYDTDAALEGLGDQHDELGDSVRRNRIQIEEIRLAAAKAGRDLTDEETAQIEELQLANRELRLSQLRLTDQIDETREKREEQAEAVAEQRDAVETAETARQQLIEEGLAAEEQALADAETARAEALDAYIDNFRDFVKENPVDFLINLAGAFEDAGPTADALSESLDLVSISALRALGSNEDLLQKIQEANAEWETATSLQREFEISSGSLGAEMQRLENQWKSLLIPIGQEFIPYLKDATNGLNNLLSEFATFRDSLGSTEVAMITVAALIGGIGIAIAALSGPVLAAIALVAGLATAWENNWGGIRDITDSAISEILALWDEHGPEITATVNELLDDIREFWAEWGDEIEMVARVAFSVIAFVVVTALDVILTAVSIFGDLLTGDWEGIANTIVGFWGRMWERLSNIAIDILPMMLSVIYGGLAQIAVGFMQWVNRIHEIVVTGFNDIAWEAANAFVTAYNKAMPGERFDLNLRDKAEVEVSPVFRGVDDITGIDSEALRRNIQSRLASYGIGDNPAVDRRRATSTATGAAGAFERDPGREPVDVRMEIDVTGDDELADIIQRNASVTIEERERQQAEFADNLYGRGSGV